MGYGFGQTTSHGSKEARERGENGKRVKAIFDNHMVAHVWAQRSQTFGRSGNGNFSFEGDVIYSYRTPIARFVETESGETVVLHTCESFSVTTSGHKSKVHSALRQGLQSFTVPSLGSTYAGSINHAKNLTHLIKCARNILSEAAKVRKESWRADYFRNAVEGAFEPAENYAKAFGLAWDINPTAEINASKAAYAANMAKWNDPKQVAKRAKAAERREALKEKKKEAERLAQLEQVKAQHAANLSHFAAWQAGERERPNHWYFEEGSTERALIEAAIKAEREQEARESGEAFKLWQEGKAPRPACHRFSWGTPERAAIEADIEREKEAERAAKVADWLAGLPVRLAYSGEMLLRAINVVRNDSGKIIAGELQTSLGATVPLTHAIRVFQFVKHCRESGTPWTRNGRQVRVGHFSLDSIDCEGNFIAGCHNIPWSEVERLAVALGVFELPADSTVAAHTSQAA